MITHIKKIIPQAVKGVFAIGAFNTVNLETTRAILAAAEKMKSPAIIQVSEKTMEYAGVKTIAAIIRQADLEYGIRVPVAIHLDHGHTLEAIKKCIAAGFSSVQIDASLMPFLKNIAFSRRAVEYAHRRGVWVQAELGSILGKEGLIKMKQGLKPEDYMTDPGQVGEYVKKTGVDTLAVSVGTMHGSFRGKEKIYFDRLAAISKKTKVPLVLHGASGIKNGDLSKAVKMGIRIVNLDTELRLAFVGSLKQTLKKETGMIDPREVLRPSIGAVGRVVEEKIRALGSKGKA